MTWQTWMVILAFAIPKPIAVFAFCEALTLKYKKAYVLWSYVAGCTLIVFLRSLCFIYMPFIPDGVIFVIVLPVYSFAFFRLVCRDKSSKVVLIIGLLYALAILGHILATVVFYLAFSEPSIIDFVSNNSMYVGFIAMVFEGLFYYIFFFIWRRYIGKINSDIPNMWAFLLVIGGQMIYSLTHLLTTLSKPTEINPWSALGIVIITIGNLALLQILLTNSKKKEAEDSLKEILHIRELEQMHYSSIEARRQEMVKIRHDFNNQLAAVRQLIDSDKKEHAEELLNELKQSLANAAERAYCQNAIVNAVFTEKQKECDNADIVLDTEITIDERCSITPIHLCSIFTNLLDNAIRACKTLPQAKRRIEIRTASKGAYLHIKSVNPVADFTEKERHGKGYGKIILSDIASHYGGNFTAEKSDNTYVAMMSVLYTA